MNDGSFSRFEQLGDRMRNDPAEMSDQALKRYLAFVRLQLSMLAASRNAYARVRRELKQCEAEQERRLRAWRGRSSR